MSRFASHLSRCFTLLLVLSVGACGGGTPRDHNIGPLAADEVRRVSGHPPLALIAREGDPAPAVAVNVFTEGVDPAHESEVAVALGAMVEGRLAAKGFALTMAPSSDAYRFSTLLTSDAQVDSAAAAIVSALLSPATASDLPAVTKKLAALSKRPLREPALRPIASCNAEPFASQIDPFVINTETLEAWRAAAHGTGRIGVAFVGASRPQSKFSDAFSKTATFGSGKKAPAAPSEGPSRAIDAYDSSGSAPTRTAQLQFAVPTRTAAEAIAAATLLGEESGALEARLRASDPNAHVKSAAGIAHWRGGCLSVSIEISDLSNESAPRIAKAIAIAKSEIPLSPSTLAKSVARSATDPREAAERAARWLLSEPQSGAPSSSRVSVGVSLYRDAPPANDSSRAMAIMSEIDSLVSQVKIPPLQFQSMSEKGQAENWLLIGIPCSDDDSGLNAAAVATLARDAKGASSTSDFAIEPWVTNGAVGLVLHGSKRPNESAEAFQHRLGNAAGAAWFGTTISSRTSALVRTELWRKADTVKERALALIGAKLFSGHSSILSPAGTADALTKLSDSAVDVRVQSFRRSGARGVLLSNGEIQEPEAIRKAIERWALPTTTLWACPAGSDLPPPGAGIVRFDGRDPEAWIALPIADLPASRESARALASLLDSENSPLQKSLSGSVRSVEARVLGSRALVVHLSAPDAALDSAVTQVRLLYQRLRDTPLTDADLQRANASFAARRLGRQADPRERLGALFLNVDLRKPPPSATQVNAFIAQELKDDALVVAVSRPPQKP